MVFCYFLLLNFSRENFLTSLDTSCHPFSYQVDLRKNRVICGLYYTPNNFRVCARLKMSSNTIMYLYLIFQIENSHFFFFILSNFGFISTMESFLLVSLDIFFSTNPEIVWSVTIQNLPRLRREQQENQPVARWLAAVKTREAGEKKSNFSSIQFLIQVP